jgi:hypothetical protein
VAIATQSVLAAIVTVITFFVYPAIAGGNAADLSSRVYLVFQAAITVIWCLSMVFLFVDVLYVIRKFSAEFAERKIAHPAVFWVCSIIGAIASFFGVWTVFTNPFSAIIGKTDWVSAVLAVSLLSLAVIPIVYVVGRRVAHDAPLPPEAQAVSGS